MCGIAGVVRQAPSGVSPELLARMGGAIRHRGPDGFGVYSGERAGLVHVRLSIIDLAGGAQPMGNEDGNLLVVFNGEVYNYIELRRQLRRAGHRFRTSSDTEVLLHGYEEWGTDLPHRLNGQFAFAILDRRANSLFLARDMFGIHPLFYAQQNGDFYFASEAKALFASGEVDAAPDYSGLGQVFTLWAAGAPATVFRGVKRLEPGCFSVLRGGQLRVTRYHTPAYTPRPRSADDAMEELDALLTDSVRLRLRADVPVGGYLSGGLDSTVTCTLAAAASPHRLRTFSVAFDDPALDERAFQDDVAQTLGSQHHRRVIGGSDVAGVFRDVVWHAETPLVRTGPAPMFVLAQLTRDCGIKVVLTGEGADELFFGYDLFKEVVIRHFCLRQPSSKIRPRLFDRLYPYLQAGAHGGELWRRTFLNAGPREDPLFSHQPRMHLTNRINEFLSPGAHEVISGSNSTASLRDSLPADFARWSPLAKAAHLEVTTLLEPYLLASQGERMALAHGVEARYPFLDPRLYAFATSLPDDMKLSSLDEKRILREWARDRVLASVVERSKQPYRAPDAASFFGAHAPAYVAELFEPARLRDTGVFDPARVDGLLRRCRAGRATGFGENQALVAILSTQVWHESFFQAPRDRGALPLGRADVLIVDGARDREARPMAGAVV